MSDDAPPTRTTLGMATALVLLKTRRYRRNLLFGLTALALFLVLGGVVFLDGLAEAKPIGFVVFWLGVFLLVMFILMLAGYDFLQIRKEAKREMRSLEERLAEAQAEVLRESED